MYKNFSRWEPRKSSPLENCNRHVEAISTLQYFSTDKKQVKRNLISNITNLVYELPHGLSNNFGIRSLGN